jgi:YD repeat-containing protein
MLPHCCFKETLCLDASTSLAKTVPPTWKGGMGVAYWRTVISQALRRRRTSSLMLFLGLAMLGTFTWAIDAQVGIPKGGFTPEHDYSNSAIDSVDLDSGNLVLNIPIVSYKQRGNLQDFTLVARYNVPSWATIDDNLQISSPSWILRAPGFEEIANNTQNSPSWIFTGVGVQVVRGDALQFGSFDIPIEGSNGSSILYSEGYVEDGTGSQHLLYADLTTNSGRAMDGSGIATGPTGNILDAKGNIHTGVADLQGDGYADSISDPTGNNTITPIVYQSAGAAYGQVLDHWVDSVGRIIPAPPGGYLGLLPAGCFTYQFPSTNATTAPYTFCYTQSKFLSNFGNPNIAETGAPQAFLTSIQFPNGTSYQFQYDSWGEIFQITLPSGGTINYNWATWGNGGSASGRVLQSRTVNPYDSASSEKPRPLSNLPIGTPGPASQRTWTYCFAIISGCNVVNGLHTMIDPDGNETDRQYMSKTTQYQGLSSNGIVLKSVLSTPCANQTDIFFRTDIAEPTLFCTKTTTLSNGDVYTETITYDTARSVGDSVNSQGSFEPSPNATKKSIGIVDEDTLTSFGTTSAGSPLRTTQTQHLWEANTAYLTANFMNLPSMVTVEDGSNNLIAQTKYHYDESGSPQGIYGNQTSITKEVGSGFADVATLAVYNAQGMVTDTYDGNYNAGVSGQPGNHVSTVYDSTGLYPSSVTQSSTSGSNHVDYYAFDMNSSSLTSHTDQNGTSPTDTAHMTVWSYDNIGRATSVAYPDGGGSSYCYTDVGGSVCGATPAPYSVYTSTSLVGAAKMLSSMSYDGVGEVISKTDPSGATISTNYDLEGRVRYQSNPSIGIPSYYVSSSYDPLNRQLYKCNQDNGNAAGACTGTGSSFTTAQYTGPDTKVTDENGHSRVMSTDSLGRLTSVQEPNGAMSYYEYDVLGNLTCAAQDGGSGTAFTSCAAFPACSSAGWHLRRFSYDSLSRLTSACNPESGTTSYIYDANGNVAFKTEGRGYQTSYSYDSMNRILRMTIPVINNSGAVAQQFFSTCYQYDNIAGAPGSANLIGHLSAEWTQTGGTCASSYTPSVPITAKLVLSYDVMGRPLLSQQCVKAMCTSNPYTQNQTYNLAGDMTSWTDGRQYMTFTENFDWAGRPASITNSISGEGLPSVLFSAQGYTAFGSLQNWNVGGYLNFVRNYDSRLRVSSEMATH